MKKELLFALLLLTAPPASAQRSSEKQSKRFRHEFAIAFRALQVPVGDWRNSTLYHFMPEYSVRYLNRYGLKIGLLGWIGKRLDWSYEKRPFYIGQIIERRYVYWEILPFYSFKLGKLQSINLGVGYSSRRGEEVFVDAIYTFDTIFGGYDVNDNGVVGELSYTHDIDKHFVAGADVAYRTYDRGDPVITAGLKFGIVLRH